MNAQQGLRVAKHQFQAAANTYTLSVVRPPLALQRGPIRLEFKNHTFPVDHIVAQKYLENGIALGPPFLRPQNLLKLTRRARA
ncbi:hypothetical protein FHX06_006568 [Rhizobium sp. BK512]|uniref:hypothetical protein n=1 Tax=Rhizobium sp. BK512 TaxID=2587010 RepID=UPI001610BD36|nr:hypothetical protein [Rhizobium sp. BK512]MBB3565198.1 hypothetical protein [Rhizobium sp. BK512]